MCTLPSSYASDPACIALGLEWSQWPLWPGHVRTESLSLSLSLFPSLCFSLSLSLSRHAGNHGPVDSTAGLLPGGPEFEPPRVQPYFGDDSEESGRLDLITCPYFAEKHPNSV